MADSTPLAVAPTAVTPAAVAATAVPQAVAQTLADFLAAESAELTALDPALEPLASAVRTAVDGGKRVRPVFAYWGWRAGGGEGPVDAVVPALAALELLHAFALVHDDVMDCSDTRRGRPTAHQALAETHRRARLIGDPRRFGESSAILVGDLCLVWADRLMARADVAPARLAAARWAYDRMRVEAIAGQFLDVLGENAPVWTVDRALRTARLKTAGYTVVRPLHFGSALAGSPGDGLTRYGVAVGEAFQLRDDLLGAFGDPADTGKPVGDDLVQGKPTVLLQIARERSPIPLYAHDAVELAERVRATGAPEVVQNMIEVRVADAKRSLREIALPEDVHDALVSLADAVAWRSS